MDDRPYAAWLYLGFAFSFKDDDIMHFVELDVGMVGPSALGKEVQNGFHDLIHEIGANGWINSIHDEPTLQLFYQKRFKDFKDTYFDFFPYYGGGFGNVKIAAHVGGIVRLGVNLPEDFGPSRPSASDGDSYISPTADVTSSKKSYYVFGGARGNYIYRNIFLDGNTLQRGPHVRKYPFTFETELGVGWQSYSWAAVWRFVTRSPEFEERSLFNSFACINVIHLF